MNYSKSELMEIYNRAKKGKYDLNELSFEQIEKFNILIEEEIKLKLKKLINNRK